MLIASISMRRRRRARSIPDRPPQGGRPNDSNSLPPQQEQPALCRRSRRGQDRDCGRPRQENHRRQVPDVLKGAVIFSLDMGVCWPARVTAAISKSASRRCSARLKNICSRFVYRRNSYCHRCGRDIGGAMDASNLLKPALSNGSLRCIGSTTYKEYRNYFEKDRALVRRFQKIDVYEPSVEESIEILTGLKSITKSITR
jgi:hypothetical protein